MIVNEHVQDVHNNADHQVTRDRYGRSWHHADMFDLRQSQYAATHD